MKKSEKNESRIAYFISPHGFGHAARAAAIMEAATRMDQRIFFEIYSLIPEWFFQQSAGKNFVYHLTKTDIGMVQASPVREDIFQTVEALEGFLPFPDALLDDLAARLQKSGCRLVLCDISPLGLAAAQRAGIPSVLIENFTWDWIYQGYADVDPRMQKFSRYLRDIFNSANYLIQTEPVCVQKKANLCTRPVARKPRLSAKTIRSKLNLDLSDSLVLISMGGIQEGYRSIEALKKAAQYKFLIPGGAEELCFDQNLILMPHHHEFFHPDLVQASDAVVGKVGYSTIAEVYQAEKPFLYQVRPRFPESPILTDYVQKTIPSQMITEEEYRSGDWIKYLDRLLNLPLAGRDGVNGADQAAGFIWQLLRP